MLILVGQYFHKSTGKSKKGKTVRAQLLKDSFTAYVGTVTGVYTEPQALGVLVDKFGFHYVFDWLHADGTLTFRTMGEHSTESVLYSFTFPPGKSEGHGTWGSVQDFTSGTQRANIAMVEVSDTFLSPRERVPARLLKQ